MSRHSPRVAWTSVFLPPVVAPLVAVPFPGDDVANRPPANSSGDGSLAPRSCAGSGRGVHRRPPWARGDNLPKAIQCSASILAVPLRRPTCCGNRSDGPHRAGAARVCAADLSALAANARTRCGGISSCGPQHGGSRALGMGGALTPHRLDSAGGRTRFHGAKATSRPSMNTLELPLLLLGRCRWSPTATPREAGASPQWFFLVARASHVPSRLPATSYSLGSSSPAPITPFNHG